MAKSQQLGDGLAPMKPAPPVTRIRTRRAQRDSRTAGLPSAAPYRERRAASSSMNASNVSSLLRRSAPIRCSTPS